MQLNEKNTATPMEMKFVISCCHFNSADEFTHKSDLVIKLDEARPVKQALATTAA